MMGTEECAHEFKEVEKDSHMDDSQGIFVCPICGMTVSVRECFGATYLEAYTDRTMTTLLGMHLEDNKS